MKRRPTGPTRRKAALAAEEPPDLPVYKAFVLQFTRETRTHGGAFSGRLEHMSSGRRARFASRQELLGALEKMLDELGEEGT